MDIKLNDKMENKENGDMLHNNTNALLKENDLMKTWISALEVEKNTNINIINDIKNNHYMDMDKLKLKLEQCRDQ